MRLRLNAAVRTIELELELLNVVNHVIEYLHYNKRNLSGEVYKLLCFQLNGVNLINLNSFILVLQNNFSHFTLIE